MKLAGKRALVTGGSSGIGLALARRLLAEGVRVVVTGRRGDRVVAAVEILRATGDASGVTADVATNEGRAATLDGALAALGGLDVLVNNAGGVRAGRLEDITEAEIRAMIEVDLVAPILLTRAALPALRASGDGLVVNVTSGAALIGVPYYGTYAATKAGLARFGEALRRELGGEGVRVMTAYPAATATPMMESSRAGADLGFDREPAEDVADAIVEGMLADVLEVIRGGERRTAMIAMNRDDPAAIDARFASLKPALAEAVRDHAAL